MIKKTILHSKQINYSTKVMLTFILAIVGIVAWWHFSLPSWKKETLNLTFGGVRNEFIVYLRQDGYFIKPENFFGNQTFTYKSEKTKLEALFDDVDWGKYKYYDLDTDTYQILQPGGQIEVSLYSHDDITTKNQEHSETYDKISDTMTITTCRQLPRRINNISAVAYECVKSSHILGENMRLVDMSTTIDCYLRLDKEIFLAIKQISKPISTDIDLCSEIESFGLQDVSYWKR